MASLNEINNFLSIFFSITIFILESFVILRLRFRLDFAAYVIFLAYSFSMLFRTPWVFQETDLNLVHATASMLIWGSLYFFVFEMKKLAEILKSDNFE